MSRITWILAPLLLFIGCSGDDPITDASDDQEAAFAASGLATQEAALLTQLAATVAMSTSFYSTSTGTTKRLASCLTATLGDVQDGVFTVVLDAGDGCMVNGVTFRGTMTVAVSVAPASGQITSTATFEDFSIDDQHVDGTLDTTVSFSGGEATGTTILDLMLSTPDATITATADLDVTVNTQDTPSLDDDAVAVSGTTALAYDGSDVVVAAALDLDPASPLVFQNGCAFPVTGQMEADVTTPDRSVHDALVDFAPVNGGCDSIAEVTINGFTRTVDLTDLGDEG